MANDKDRHRAEVMACIEGARSLGASDFHEILEHCDGADPRLVAECLASVVTSPTQPAAILPSREKPFLRLPAPNPFWSQWWFTGATVELICGRVSAGIRARGGRVLCLGAATVGHQLVARGVDTLVLDVDEDLVQALNTDAGKNVAQTYDAADDLPPDLSKQFAVAIIDPPWYERTARTFLWRAMRALAPGGELLMTLLPRLTRPDADQFRATIIDELRGAGNDLLALERRNIRYLVPRFEEVALRTASGFRGIPWRGADLLHARKRSDSEPTLPALSKVPLKSFARNPREFRVFMRNGCSSAHPHVVLEVLPNYSENVSTRAHAGEDPDLWTSEKVGAKIGNAALVEAILTVWKDPTVRRREDAVELLEKDHPGLARSAVEELDRHLELWSRFAAQPPLRTEEEIEKAKRTSLTAWASAASAREHSERDDKFRAAYQRDRDRVLWSGAFRRLGHKTQLFPAEHDEQTRQRLTHSMEVMQLASTIGSSFGLDGDLIEAGALAHDIGHTPFGHAGEHALQKLLNQIDPDLGGFNHYEHGVDVLRWLEGPYYSSHATSFHGLNLTPEVAECVLKHTFCHAGGGISSEQLLKGKHRDFIPAGYCHLEGQAVRIADKISYFISDLEDGLRLAALSLEDLLACHFFHRMPLSFKNESSVGLYRSFLTQRGTVLKLLMEDVLVSTEKRLVRATPSSVRGADGYMVNHSEEMARDVTEVWERLQKKLHRDRRVRLASLRATRIVSDLTVLLAAAPGLIDPDFAAEHSRLNGSAYMAYYRKAGEKVGLPAELLAFLPLERLIDFHRDPGRPLHIPVENLVQAKDFVAALTDSRASALHHELLGG
jgi:dGTPase